MKALFGFVLAGCVPVLFTACGGHREGPRASYLPLAEVERTYGRLISAGNHPTADQHGTGERVGLFEDVTGTVWGLPISIGVDGAVAACAPRGLHNAPVTDGFAGGSTIIGATNGPTGWRGGTGKLELLLRDSGGSIRGQSVDGAAFPDEAACGAPESPGPVQRLHYYRLTPRVD